MKKLLGILLLAGAIDAAEVTRVEPWVLSSSFWSSLHERLRHESQQAELHALAENPVWKEALAVYRKELGTKSPVFNAELQKLTHTLARTADDAIPADVPAPLAAALQSAASVYRAKLWSDDDRANRFWIAIAAAQLRDAGDELLSGVARLYGTPWPKTLYVDVVPYAEDTGAFTTNERGFAHTSINSLHPTYQGFAALEMLLHEPMHHIDWPLQEEIAALAKETGVAPPRGLSHVILFYTSGELTRRALARRGVRDYKPFAYAHGVYTRAWPKLIAPVEKHWLPYMDGKGTRQEALRTIVAELEK